MNCDLLSGIRADVDVLDARLAEIASKLLPLDCNFLQTVKGSASSTRMVVRDPAWWLPDGSFSCPMGKLTKREVDQAVLQFTAFDVDDDGVVSYEDFATAMTRHNPALAHPSKKCGRGACHHHTPPPQTATSPPLTRAGTN